MPVIAFASSKGGVGKTTTALTVASALAAAENGGNVVILDADPNQHLMTWAGLPGAPERIDVRGGFDSETIVRAIEDARAEARFVLVDLEGTAQATVTFAIAASDFVVIPVQGSQLDAIEAAKVIRLIKSTERMSKSTIPYAVLFSRTSAVIQGKTLRHIQSQLAEGRTPMFETQMLDREAFRTVFQTGGTVFTLGPKVCSGLSKAQDNAAAMVQELLNKIKRARNLVAEAA